MSESSDLPPRPSQPGERVIHIHQDAPPQPREGQPCNGCGVCCLTEPCPAGMLITRRRHGACGLLSWSDADRRYLCGLVTGASVWPGPGWPRLSRLARRLAMRWIAAGVGCDATLQSRPGP